MKKNITILIVMILAVMFGLKSFAVNSSDVSGINITGKRKVSVPADMVSIHFRTEIKVANKSDALQKSETQSKKIIAFFNSYGKITKESFCLYEDSYTGNFVVSQNYLLTSTKTDQVDSITEGLISKGVSCIGYINYFLINTQKYELDSLNLAIKDAERRASSLGIKMKIKEINDFGSHFSFYDTGEENKGYVTSECTVSVIYN